MLLPAADSYISVCPQKDGSQTFGWSYAGDSKVRSSIQDLLLDAASDFPNSGKRYANQAMTLQEACDDRRQQNGCCTSKAHDLDPALQ